MNLNHCIERYGHLCQIYKNNSPNMVMSSDSGFKFQKFLFSPNSVLILRKVTKFGEIDSRTKKVQAEKNKLGLENIPRPLSAYRVKPDFLSWQKSLAHSLKKFVDNFSLSSPLERVLAAWSKFFN